MADSIGLWKAEQTLIDKYFKKSGSILDVGCGAGRVSLGLAELGYKTILGIDISAAMIEAANLRLDSFNRSNFKRPIFLCRDICTYKPKMKFQYCIFSYNGLWCIQGSNNRKQALRNILHLLSDNGLFIFTSHIDYRKDLKYRSFWAQKYMQYIERGDPIDDNFGDLIVDDKGILVYHHFTTDEEVLQLIRDTDFLLIETATRNQLALEEPLTEQLSENCRFWICQKSSTVV